MTDTRQAAIDAFTQAHGSGYFGERTHPFDAGSAAAVVDALTEHLRSLTPPVEAKHEHTWIEVGGKPHSCACGAPYREEPAGPSDEELNERLTAAHGTIVEKDRRIRELERRLSELIGCGRRQSCDR